MPDVFADEICVAIQYEIEQACFVVEVRVAIAHALGNKVGRLEQRHIIGELRANPFGLILMEIEEPVDVITDPITSGSHDRTHNFGQYSRLKRSVATENFQMRYVDLGILDQR